MWDMRMYNKFGNPYFSDRPCPDCGSHLGDHNTNYNAGTGPIGPDGVKTKVFIKYCDEHYHQRARERMSNRYKNQLLNREPAQKVLDFISRKPPKFNQGKYKSPLSRAVAKSKIKTDPDVSREGPGFVYVYEDEMKEPGVLKIGSTKYSKGRLSSANTWGAFNCLYEMYFERRFEAEDMAHTILADYRIWSDKEWFRVSLEQAIKAIEGVNLDNTKEQALG